MKPASLIACRISLFSVALRHVWFIVAVRHPAKQVCKDRSVGIICLGLKCLFPIMSTFVLYKQLVDVGGVLRLTSPSQSYLHSTSAQKSPESLLPCHRFNRERVADHKATLQTQAVNFSETTTISTH